MDLLRCAISSDPHVPDRGMGFLSWHINILPTLSSLAKCTALVMDTDMEPSEREATRISLLKELEVTVARFVHWCAGMRAMKPKPPPISSSLKGTTEAEQLALAYRVLLTRWQGVLDVSEVAILMQHRICAALGGTQSDTELESSKKAAWMLEKYRSDQDGSLEHSTRLLVVPNASALLQTTKEWYEYIGSPIDGVHRRQDRLVPRDLYAKWLSLMGIRLPGADT